MKKYLLFFVSFLSLLSFAQNLPHYKLTITPANLDSMNAHPKDEVYYPAEFMVDAVSYNVLARFKGSTSLNFPKKSWSIKFDDASNVFGATRINLHADYKDYSNMRNFLLMNLFDYLGSPASKMKHVTYEVNGVSYGVFTQTEQIDDEYLTRNNRTVVALYKAKNHGALMAPAVRDDYYDNIWQIEAGGDTTYNDLRTLFNKCLYWSKSDFDANIANEVEIDNFINFFAVHFVFVDMDNFTKNIFLNKNSNSSKFEFLPWDNEGSFGNSALGVFDSTLVSYNMKDAFTPEYQVVFQRLLENSAYKAMFQARVTKIITEGFDLLYSLIDETYLKIKQDVYADDRREATNEDFDNSIPRLKWFMANRKAFIENNALPQRSPLSNFYCSNPFPNATNPMVTFRITSPVVQAVNVFFADSVNFNIFGKPFKFSRVQLYDDGLHDDLLANDLIYGNTIDASTFVSNTVPFAITGAEQNYPPNGIFYIDYYGSKSYAINKGNVDSDVAGRVQIGKVYNFNNNNFVEIINTSSTFTADLSYCHLRTNVASNDFMFRDNIVLAPNETIYIAPSKKIGNLFFPGKRSFDNLYFPIVAGDSLHLLSPVLTSIVSKLVEAQQTLIAEKTVLVFNEINFKSGAVRPTADWVEIYNPNASAVDLTGWIFKDGNNDHAFVFPAGYMLPTNGYVVVAENLPAFQAVNPDVTNVVGSTDFGLSSTGEYIRLYDKYSQLVDSVNYGIDDPWPIGAYGTGSTIELTDHTLDNSVGANWYVDPLKYGSPGVHNFVTVVNTSVAKLYYSVYPNPTNGYFYVKTSVLGTRMELIALDGTIIKSILIQQIGDVVINVSDVQKGMYLVRLTSGSIQQTEKLIIK